MRDDPKIYVTCDICEDTITEVGLTSLAQGAYDERNVDKVLISNGWTLDNETEQDICPDCADYFKDLKDSQA